MQSEKMIVRQQINNSPHFVGQISINVEQPIKNQNETFPYFTYNILGSDVNGMFTVRRRYRDFDLLRTKLTQRWLGIYIPPISGKRSQSNFLNTFKKLQSKNGNSQLRYAQTRKRFLKYFCEGIAVRPYLFYCDLFQMFLRGGYDYEAAIRSSLDKDYSFILNEYQNNFKGLVQATQTFNFSAALELNEGNLRELKQSQQKLIAIYQAILRSICARNEFNQQLNVCLTTALPQYQEKIFLNYVGKDRNRLILGKNEQFNVKVTQLKTLSALNPQELFLQLVAYEIRQTKAFIQAIEGRKEAQRKRNALKQNIDSKNKQMAKLMSGGFSLRSVFKSGSKELQAKQLQIKIQIRKNELYCIQKMIVIMVANTNYQIQQFKLKRGKSYGQLFKTVAEKELIELNTYNQLLNLLQVEV